MNSGNNRDWIASLFSFNGRSSRSTFWLCFIFITPLLQILNFSMDITTKYDNESVVLGLILLLLLFSFLWIQLAVSSRRCHDLGLSAWFVLIGFIPIIGTIGFLVRAGFYRGTVGENRFGADPLA